MTAPPRPPGWGGGAPGRDGGGSRAAGRAGVGNGGGIHGGPVGFGGQPFFVADPADVGARVGEDDRRRLERVDQAEDPGPVVHLAAAVGSLAVGAVEPDLADGSVLAEQLGELRGVQIVVARGVAVGGLVPVPRREVEPRLELLRPACLHELPDQITPAAAPGAPRHRVRGGPGGPEAEAVVMLRGEDHRAESGRARRGRPLPGIECPGREDRRVLLSVAPLPVGEGVHAEVEEERELVALPRELRRRRHRPSSRRRGRGSPWASRRRDGAGGGGQEAAAWNSSHQGPNLPGRRPHVNLLLHMPRLLVLFVTAFVDMVGLTMILPLLPFYAKDLGASAAVGALLIPAFSVPQLARAPVWGRPSDRSGRRPAILAGLLVSGAAYVLFAFAGSVALLFLSRVVQGMGGGTIGVVQAYVADASPPAERVKSLGWLSAVTSFGAVGGPAFGSALVAFGGRTAPGLGAAGLSLLVAAFAWRCSVPLLFPPGVVRGRGGGPMGLGRPYVAAAPPPAERERKS